jgi:hypothetical protein
MIDQIEVSDVPVVVVDEKRCAVCPHDTDQHDVIGRRYCEATQMQALHRGCICRSV